MVPVQVRPSELASIDFASMIGGESWQRAPLAMARPAG
jgi:hypothetical protein